MADAGSVVVSVASEAEENSVGPESQAEAQTQAQNNLGSGAPEGYKFLVSEPEFQAQFGLLSPPLFDYSLPDFMEKKPEDLDKPTSSSSSSSSSSPAAPAEPPSADFLSSVAAVVSSASPPDFTVLSLPDASTAQEPQAPNIPPLSLPVLLSLTPSDFTGPIVSLSEEQNALALQIFAKADINANGFLEPDELKQALSSANFTVSQKTVLRLIKNVLDRVLLKRSLTDLPGGGEVLTSQADFCLALASEYSRGAANLSEKRSLSTPVLEASYHSQSQTQSQSQSNFRSHLEPAIPPPASRANFRPELYGTSGVPTAAVRVRAIALNSTSDPYFAAMIASLASLAPRNVSALLKENMDKSCDVVFNRRYEKAITVVPPSVSDIMRYGLAFEYGYWFLVLDKAYGIYLATKSRLATKLGDASGSFARANDAMQALLSRSIEAVVLGDFTDDLLISKFQDLAAKTEPVLAIAGAKAADYLPLYRENFPYPVVGFNPQKNLIQVYCLPWIGSAEEMQKARDQNNQLFVWLSLNEFREAFRALYLPAQNNTSTPLNWLKRK